MKSRRVTPLQLVCARNISTFDGAPVPFLRAIFCRTAGHFSDSIRAKNFDEIRACVGPPRNQSRSTMQTQPLPRGPVLSKIVAVLSGSRAFMRAPLLALLCVVAVHAAA